jgi:hypothetical protein
MLLLAKPGLISFNKENCCAAAIKEMPAKQKANNRFFILCGMVVLDTYNKLHILSLEIQIYIT